MRNWTRRKHDRILGGVLAGLAESISAPLGLIRAVFILSVVMSAGAALGLYVLLWWLLPEEGTTHVEPSVWQEQPDGRFSAPFERTQLDRKCLGVAGGLARYWGVDALWIRLAFIAGTLSVTWIAPLAYVALALCMKGPRHRVFNAPFTSVRPRS